MAVDLDRTSKLADIVQRFTSDNGGEDALLYGIASRVSAKGISEIADGLVTIHDAGFDPTYYIAEAPGAAKAAKAKRQLAQDDLDREQARAQDAERHAKDMELQDIEIESRRLDNLAKAKALST